MISHAEAQELHECIGTARDCGDTPMSTEEYDALTRALELASIVVSDTDPDEKDDDLAEQVKMLQVGFLILWKHVFEGGECST